MVWIVYDEPDSSTLISLYGVFTTREQADAVALEYAREWQTSVSVCSQPIDTFIDFHRATGSWPGTDNHTISWHDGLDRDAIQAILKDRR